MRRLSIIACALGLVACSKQTPAENAAQPKQAADSTTVGNMTDTAGPDIAPAVLPGVALTYAYTVRLPAARIARAQEQHAALCESLGPARCRITGMNYHTQQGRTVFGELHVALAPEFARRFGRQGIAIVVADGGMLTDASIDSIEAGRTIADADQNSASVAEEQRAIGTRLAQRGLGDAERSQLEARSTALRDTVRTTAAERNVAVLALASTPLVFNYQSGIVDTGFGDGPVLGAVKDGWANIISGVALLLMLAITVIPWMAAILAIVWLVRRFGVALGLRRPPG